MDPLRMLPYELWERVASNVDNIRVFGQVCTTLRTMVKDMVWREARNEARQLGYDEAYLLRCIKDCRARGILREKPRRWWFDRLFIAHPLGFLIVMLDWNSTWAFLFYAMRNTYDIKASL